MFIRYIFYSLVLAVEQVKIVYADDPNIFLSIVVNKKGNKSVRFMDQRRTSDYEILDVFTVTEQPTKLLTSKGFICGKTTDPGVVTCDYENELSLFSFVKDNQFINIKTKNSKCLTKRDIDRTTKGFYLNLSPCKNTINQRFFIKPVIQTPTISKTEDYKNFYCPSHKEYDNFIKSTVIVEKHLKNMENYLIRARECKK